MSSETEEKPVKTEKKTKKGKQDKKEKKMKRKAKEKHDISSANPVPFNFESATQGSGSDSRRTPLAQNKFINPHLPSWQSAHTSSLLASQVLHHDFEDEPLTEYQKQQRRVLDPLLAISPSRRKQEAAEDASNGSIAFSQGSVSLSDSYISEITLHSAHLEVSSFIHEDAAPKQDRTEVRRASQELARRKSSRRLSHTSGRHGFLEKAAILEDYEYDYEGSEVEEEEHAAHNHAPHEQAVAQFEKWEVLADDFDDAAFDKVAFPNEGNQQSDKEMLIMYLQSMGADLAAAEWIAHDFEKSKKRMKSSKKRDKRGSKIISADSSRARLPQSTFLRSANMAKHNTSSHQDSPLESTSNESPALHDVDHLCVESGMITGVPLVEAIELSEEPRQALSGESEVMYAEITQLSLKSLMRDHRFRRAFLIIAVILSAVLVNTLSVTLTRNKASEPVPSETPSTSPSAQPTRIDSDMADILIAATHSEALLSDGTPQRRALTWMSTFDMLRIDLTDPQLLQRYALVVLYFATGGEFWLESEAWLDPLLHECDWGATTIECDSDSSSSRQLRSLDLSRQSMKGQLPIEIEMFRYLTSLKLSKNELNGTIPSQVFDLQGLQRLELSGNLFTGSIPSELSLSASDLSYLDISGNQLVSSIPEALFNLSNIDWLDLSANMLTGTISSGLVKLKFLNRLNLRHNMFGGPIPNFFDDIVKLDFIYFDDNMFTGTIPPWSAAMLSRQELTISHNQLIGTIPGALSMGFFVNIDLTVIRLATVDLSFNLLTGTFPAEVSLVPSIRFLYISGNELVGTLPNGGYGHWRVLEEVLARDCSFEGQIPFGFSDSIRILDFSGNTLTGQLPTLLASFPRLQSVSLSNNQLSSTIPDEIAKLSTLKILKLRNCSLSGTVPIGFATNEAQILDFGLNQLIGTIDAILGNITTLESLRLDGNAFSGTIPTELASLDLLANLTLDDNYLTGTIPSNFGMLTSLLKFTVTNNLLTGSVPEGVCTLLPQLGAKDIGCNIDCSCCSDVDLCV